MFDVVKLRPDEPESSEEKARKLATEAERLAGLGPVEWRFWAEKAAIERGIEVEPFIARVQAIRHELEKAKNAAAVDEQRRAERQASEARREHEQRHKARAKDKEQTFKRLAALPRLEQERGLAALAARIEVDEDSLSEEFYREFAPPPPSCAIEPWDEPVEATELLTEVISQVRRYVVVEDHQALAIALWAVFTWCHDVAVHSPLLVVTSPEQDSGKTTCVNVIGFLVPRPLQLLEASAASVYSLIDAACPTIIHDEADTILERKTDLRHIILGGWTRGATIPRKLGRVTYLFKIFCPKVIGLKFKDGRLVLPETAVSRSIIIKLKPRLASEGVEDFANADDEIFLTLRRKLLRWSTDNMESITSAKPHYPAGFINRLQQNWKLLLAIAEAAVQGNAARLAAIKLSAQETTEPSEGIRYLTAIRAMLIGCDEITSADIIAKLGANPDEDFGTISQKKLSVILGQYDIRPTWLHPTKRADKTRRGYRTTAFADAFARYKIPAPRKPNDDDGQQCSDVQLQL
jgi:Protein of unknown function (DUF3631)